MRILAQASFATGVMGEIGRVLDGTGEKKNNLLYLMQSVPSILGYYHYHFINAWLAPYNCQLHLNQHHLINININT